MKHPDPKDLVELPFDELVYQRNWLLTRVDQVTNAIKLHVQDEYEKGTPVSHLAKTAGVQRRTIYAWVKE